MDKIVLPRQHGEAGRSVLPSVPAKEPPKQKSQMSNELFEKLKRRCGQQGEGGLDIF